MTSVLSWLLNNISAIAIPLAVFVATLIATLWLRRAGYRNLLRAYRTTHWQIDKALVRAAQAPSVLWCVIVSMYLAVAVSQMPAAWKPYAGRILGSLLVLSLWLALLNLINELISLYSPRMGVPERVRATAKNVALWVIVIFAALMLMEVWGLPLAPLLVLIIVAFLAAALFLGDVTPDVLAGLQVGARSLVKVGDYVKLSSGEEGQVTDIDWRYTRIRALDQSEAIIPNRQLVRSTLVNYGQPVKKAREPFRFNTRVQIPELTGLEARSLSELAAILKQAPDSVVYYHTHHSLEEHHFLVPQLANDFAAWVSDVIGDEALGERLAAVDIFAFPNLQALKERFVGLIEECLAVGVDGRQALPGREFHFLKSISVIMPTNYIVDNLREFLEALREVSTGSLYFHMFESRMRLGKGLNDFSVWLKENLDEADLADRIARLDPYTYTSEGLRSLLVRLIEKRIEQGSRITSP